MLAGLKAWFLALSTASKVGVTTAAVVTTGITADSISPPPSPPAEPISSGEVQAESTVTDNIETKTNKEQLELNFTTSTVNDSTLALGQTVISTAGQKGIREITYEYTYRNGVEIDRKTLSDVVLANPVNEVIKKGTYVAPPPPPTNCHKSYQGACISPNVPDVDCIGGSGNGPVYVGTVTVVGPDVFDLDRDGDGIGCE